MKVVALASLLLAFGSLVAQESPPARRIIDVHLHAYPPDVFGSVSLPDPATGQPSPATERELLDLTLEAMRANGIMLGIISGPLDIVERWKANAPSSFIGAPQFPHPFPFPDQDRLRDLHQDGVVGALGEVTTQYSGLAPADELLEPYLSLAEELDIPVGIHMSTGPKATPGESGNAWAPDFRVALGNPLLLEEVLVRHPRLRIWIMHAGIPYLEETIAIMDVYPQVYADLSGVNWFWPREDFLAYLERLMRAGLGKRLMYGSDQSLWPSVGIRRSIETIETAPFLSEEEKQDIFCVNAARFLTIDEALCRN